LLLYNYQVGVLQLLVLVKIKTLKKSIHFVLLIDRALNLYWSQWKQSYGRLKYTKYYIIVLTSICIALNSHILVLNGYRTSSGIITCYATRTNPDYIYPQWERVHLVLYNLCPFAIMCICNTYIIFVTVRSSRAQIESTPIKIYRKSIERYRQFTALLILVTFAFVILTSPACIYYVFFRNNLALKAQRNYRYMVQILLNSIQFTSHGINFFLYCFSAKSFRYELHGMFRELVSSCHCTCRWSFFNDNRPNGHIRKYVNNNNNNDESSLERQRMYRNREMQMNHYKFNVFPEFKSANDKNSNWI
jgi:hypothetical protein